MRAHNKLAAMMHIICGVTFFALGGLFLFAALEGTMPHRADIGTTAAFTIGSAALVLALLEYFYGDKP